MIIKFRDKIANLWRQVDSDNGLPVRQTGSNLQQNFAVLNGTSISNGYIDLEGKALVALSIPASYNGGNITFQAAATADGTYQDVYDSNGTLVTATVAGASRVVSLTGSALQALASLRYIKIKTTSNVSADRTIGVIAKG